MSDDYCHCGMLMRDHKSWHSCTTPVSMGTPPMSTVLMRREVPPVCFSGDECGQEFATTSCDVQAQFLMAMASAAYRFDWPMQCRMIADELNADQREVLGGILSTLLHHIQEPVEARAAATT